MQSHWASYICNVNGKLASIFLDLGLRASSPDLARPWLLWAWVYFKQPRTDGLSSSDEFPILCRIEDKLNASVQHHCRSSLAGRITTDGRREFYYYAAQLDRFEAAVSEMAAAFPEYEIDLGSQHDPQWNQYVNVLFPGQDDLQKISNREVLGVMADRGDRHEVPREITHWCYFSNEKDRADFKNAISKMGYRIESESYYEKLTSPFGISFGKVESVAESSINGTVLELTKFAERFRGEYDGWEAEVISAEGAETNPRPN